MDGREVTGRKLRTISQWIGRQGRPGLWAVAVSAVVLHLVLGVHLLRTHEFIRFRPICYEDEGGWGLGSALRPVEGRISLDFRIALVETLPGEGVGFRKSWGNVLITFVDWWDDNLVWNMTTKAVWRIMERRTGQSRSDLTANRVRVNGFEEDGLPTCETLRAIAIRGGKWEREGPEVTPISP